MRPLTFLVALALVGSSLSAFAQTPLREEVTVQYVEVPVTVIARDGGPVRGLTKANFEVFDGREKRAIESFEAIDFAAAGTAQAISPLNPASRRNFLLLFDLSYSNPTSIGRAQQAARSFISRSIGARDLVAVGAIDADRGFRLLTAFTTDRELLVAAIADPRGFRAADPLQIAGATILEVPQQTATTGNERQDVALENMADIARQSGALDEAFNRTRVNRQVEMLGDIAGALQRLVGRKHLVLLSEGFDPRLVQGRTARDVFAQTEENRAVEHGEVWKVDSDQRFGSAGTQNAIAKMADQFRRADVVLHTVDIQGVRVDNSVRGGAKVNSNEGLFILSNSTGGTVFRNSNDIAADFDRLTRQHEVVYVLGFHAPAASAGEFHALNVKLVGVPGARAHHRGGYYSVGNESGIQRALSTAEVIVNDIPQDDIDVAALAAAFPADSQTAQVPVILEISGKDLVRHASNGFATAEVFVYAFEEDGTVRDSIYQRIGLQMDKVGERLQANGIRFYGTLTLPPGSYAVKTLVRVAESDMMGYRRIDLEVPAIGDVAITRPFFFDDAGDWVMVKSTSDDPNAPYPFLLDGDPFIPAVRATLRRGEPRLFTLFVYNAESDELTWDIAPVAKLVSESASEYVTKLVFALEQIPADANTLDVTIRKKGSTDARRVTVPIRVE